MANTDTPFGMRPVKHRNGAPYNGSANAYYIPSTYGTALYIGDPVVITGTANTAAVVDVGAGGGNWAAGELQEINKATAGDANAITGVIVGFAAAQATSLVYNAASTERIAFVADDPDLVFEIQADSAGTVAAAAIGLNAVLIFTHAGSTVTGLSGVELDTTSDAPAADLSNQLTIRGLSSSIGGNEIAAAHANLLVTINNHTNGYAAIGI